MIKTLFEIQSISFIKHGIKGIIKSPGIWGHKKSITFPLIYLRKPKWMKKEMFEELIENLQISLKRSKK